MKVIQVLLVLTISFAKIKLNVGDKDEMVEETQPFTFEYSTRNEVVSVNSDDSILFVGDSRTVGMYLATKRDEFSYVTKVGEGFSWLTEGTPRYNTSELILNYIEANPNGKIVFNLGVNDLYKSSDYAEWVRCLVDAYPNLDIYYLSINPSTRSSLDSQIDSFNSYIQDNIPEEVTWIDCNSYLKTAGYETWDGVHYSNSTYSEILSFVEEAVGELNLE